MQARNGKTIAIIGFVGGALIIRSLISYPIKEIYVLIGAVLVLISLVLFIMQINNIK